MRVLVIEDTPDLARFVQVLLAREGVESLLAADGEEGLAMARGESPDLILLDLFLPRLGGSELCRILKADESRRRIPVILVTGLDEAASRRVVQESGADGFLPKPIDPERFSALLWKFLGPSGKAPPRPASAPGPGGP